jgi:hypothetical protein
MRLKSVLCAKGSGLRFDVAMRENGFFTDQCIGSHAGATFSTESARSSQWTSCWQNDSLKLETLEKDQVAYVPLDAT